MVQIDKRKTVISVFDHHPVLKDAHTVTCPLRLRLGSIITAADQARLIYYEMMMALLGHSPKEVVLSSVSEVVCNTTLSLSRHETSFPLIDHNPVAEVEAKHAGYKQMIYQNNCIVLTFLFSNVEYIVFRFYPRLSRFVRV